ncbi:MAG TPA: AAA family ATPase [Euzebyales bacterium]|nr:AAA family ATPase [Euzebyales bacterium]
MPERLPISDVVGRGRIVARLDGIIERALAGDRVTVFLSGEAGIGKTALLRAAAAMAAERSARTSWGTCVDADGAAGYWPWTQALDALVRSVGVTRARGAIGEDATLLASIIPSLGATRPREATSERDRLLAMDATVRFLDVLAADRPVVIVLDDLQWADSSSLALLDFVSRGPQGSRLALLGAYRHDELPATARERLGALVARAEHFHLEGVDADAVHALVERITGDTVDRATAARIHARTAGHPFFVRELALLERHDDRLGEQVPVAVRDLIDRRVSRLPDATIAVLEAAAVVGSEVRPDVVAAVVGCTLAEVEQAARSAVVAGVLTRGANGVRFTHDLLRETVRYRVEPARRTLLHRAAAAALEARIARGAYVAPAEVAHHHIGAVAVDGPERAVQWTLRAAASDCAALAFDEAAGRLRRLRGAVADAGVHIDAPQRVEILLAEADANARAGNTVEARGLLRHAADVAARTNSPEHVARTALAIAQLGARFATRRDEVVRALEAALVVIAGVDDMWEARLLATLARELQHSVAEDRPRAGPLSARALDLSRRTRDPAGLLACLLARHDVLWTPGTSDERAAIAREIVTIARATGDEEHHAEGLLLLANALLERGSPAFEAALESYLAILDTSKQPRARYMAETRRACLALLRGLLDEAEQRIERAAALGERIREPDTGNVRMSQRLELVRARGEPDKLRSFAAEAVEHWTGAPVHAHAVAAGFCARAGVLDDARRHVAAVLDLGTWRADRSYLWSMFVRELAHAAIALDDQDLCREIYDDLSPLASSCGVNGAVVAFAGSHAHPAGLLAASLGRTEASRALLERAAASYRRLGAVGWLAEVGDDGRAGARPVTSATASMRRRGPVWQITFAGSAATVPHIKGLADIARLVAAPGAEIHALDLVGSPDRSPRPGPVVDRSALDSYRRRLADLQVEVDDAAHNHDTERRARAVAEHQALVEELGRVTGVRRQPRQFANHPAERARKAVAGRIRDAIRKLADVLPELADHLDQAVRTGTYCSYRAETTWDVDQADA